MIMPATTRNQVLTSVTEGDRVQMTLTVYGHRKMRNVMVGAYHPTEPSNHLGHWFCVTHDEHFDNQFMKDSHIFQGQHKLAWICHEHGIEQPMAEAIK